MNISSIALGGFQASRKTLESSASRIARAGSEGAASGVDLGGEMVDHLAAKHDAKANLAVIRTVHELEQRTLDRWG